MTATPLPINPLMFRQAMGRFATGIAVATTLDHRGHPLGITINSLTSVSLSPPLILFCIDREATAFPAFADAECFAINILAADQQPLSVQFALPLDAEIVPDRWDAVSWRQWATGAPILEGCLSTLECRRHALYDGGDHIILVGEVIQVGLAATDESPLLYFQGGYRDLS
ncbi:MAG: flavin reductase family protein [Alphaproteobacteria bacterium]|nr:flavin reductase family protein [Alphaproteobacteria bacterium]MBU0795982.1 flavin reductase family protein [Alphaproteobacteria bacterium]MBU0885670.1 flavin reductase family protein [Alphaproteobacteria bacterium]MBU1812674.1 flavin reductase family protein [Alphaproteobacteria bacterium]MBU2089711.1 flavin reductase family protein [Alphaproteobacteria bacterium]